MMFKIRRVNHILRCAAGTQRLRRGVPSSVIGRNSIIEMFSRRSHSRRVAKERLIVFVKVPRLGTVKTRVAQTAGHERALKIYRELVEAVLEGIRTVPNVELHFTPADALSEIQPWLRENWTAHAQGEGDLGERMHRAFADAFASGAERVVIIGSDAPEVRTGDIRAAWKELKSHDIVVGPAIDGGYWLIGLRAPQPELFREIAWSSEQVLGQTLARAKAVGLKIQLLRILTDVDTEEDWNAYVRERKH
jgi:rSAM/selenodomain-associated transferase 1